MGRRAARLGAGRQASTPVPQRTLRHRTLRESIVVRVVPVRRGQPRGSGSSISVIAGPRNHRNRIVVAILGRADLDADTQSSGPLCRRTLSPSTKGSRAPHLYPPEMPANCRRSPAEVPCLRLISSRCPIAPGLVGARVLESKSRSSPPLKVRLGTSGREPNGLGAMLEVVTLIFSVVSQVFPTTFASTMTLTAFPFLE